MRQGLHSIRAISMASELLSSLVRRTLAVLSWPAKIARSREHLKDNRCERR